MYVIVDVVIYNDCAFPVSRQELDVTARNELSAQFYFKFSATKRSMRRNAKGLSSCYVKSGYHRRSPSPYFHKKG